MAEGCSVKMFDGSLGKMYGNERVEKSIETQEPSSEYIIQRNRNFFLIKMLLNHECRLRITSPVWVYLSRSCS